MTHLELYKHTAELLGARCIALRFKRCNLLLKLLDFGCHDRRELSPVVSPPLKETIARRRPALGLDALGLDALDLDALGLDALGRSARTQARLGGPNDPFGVSAGRHAAAVLGTHLRGRSSLESRRRLGRLGLGGRRRRRWGLEAVGRRLGHSG